MIKGARSLPWADELLVGVAKAVCSNTYFCLMGARSRIVVILHVENCQMLIVRRLSY